MHAVIINPSVPPTIRSNTCRDTENTIDNTIIVPINVTNDFNPFIIFVCFKLSKYRYKQ